MKKIVIVGASSGICYAVAEAFASRGVKVGVAARRTEKLEKLHEKYPESIVVERIDICSPQAVEALNRLINRLGGMDIYFHAAGIGYKNPLMNPEEEVRIVNTDATAFARMICAAYNYFADNGIAGRIAAITSVAGTKGIGTMSAYSASKCFDSAYLEALDQLSRMKKQNISFTDIRPGWTRTPLLEDNRKYPLEMKLSEIVPQIIRAIVRKRRVAVIDFRWNLLVGLWQQIPHSVWVRMKVNAE